MAGRGSDGQSGIRAINAGHFDLVIVDLFMPDMNGLDTITAIRKNNTLTPIIVVSGFMFDGPCPKMANFEVMAVEAGAQGVLYKPLRPKVFLQAINDTIADSLNGALSASA
jgi:CheY-like chemotaxis protein